MTDVKWGAGCSKCAYTGEGWLHGTLGGDGWTGKPCPHCIEGGELCHEGYQEPPEPAPLRWCECPDVLGVGACPTCGGEMCPF